VLGQISSLVKKLSACEDLAKGLEAESKKRERNLQPVILDKQITAEGRGSDPWAWGGVGYRPGSSSPLIASTRPNFPHKKTLPA